MKRVAQFVSPPVNYVWADAKSIMILQYDGNYLLFLKDQAAARQMGKVVDRPEVLAFRDSIKVVIEKTNQGNAEANAARSKLITQYLRDKPSLRSRRPLLAKGYDQMGQNTRYDRLHHG